MFLKSIYYTVIILNCSWHQLCFLEIYNTSDFTRTRTMQSGSSESRTWKWRWFPFALIALIAGYNTIQLLLQSSISLSVYKLSHHACCLTVMSPNAVPPEKIHGNICWVLLSFALKYKFPVHYWIRNSLNILV